jgi:hypothetical protein
VKRKYVSDTSVKDPLTAYKQGEFKKPEKVV